MIRDNSRSTRNLALAFLSTSAAFTNVVADPVPGGTLDPTKIPKYVDELVIPGVMKKSDDAGADYKITSRQFKQQMLPTTGCDPSVNGPTACKKNGSFRPTKVWGYGPDGDVPPAVAPVPAAQSQFNHPSFTIEAMKDQAITVDWINGLVGNDNKYLKHLLPVDQTLHWANPGADCSNGLARTDCAGNSGKNYKGPIPNVTHVHGAHTGPESDGYPEAWYLPPDSMGFKCVDLEQADAAKDKYACQGSLANGFDVANTGGGKATFTYPNDQPSTTLWYHDHTLGMTRLNVYAMGAGFWHIRDTDPDGGVTETGLVRGALPGPAPAMGEDPNFDPAVRAKIREIPIAIQGKSFNENGSLFYPANRAFFEGLGDGQIYGKRGNKKAGHNMPVLPNPAADISPVWNPEAFFSTLLANGRTWPKLSVEPERYRFRLLNATNSRFLNLAMFTVTDNGVDGVPGNADDILGDEVPFYMIGAEQSLLPKVTKIWTNCKTQLRAGQDPDTCPTGRGADHEDEALLMGPAERADVIVDFSGMAAGTRVRMVNTAPDAPFGGFPDDAADPETTGQVMEFHLIADDPATVDNSTPPAQLRLSRPDPAEFAEVVNSTKGLPPRDLALLEEESEQLCVIVDMEGNITHDPDALPPTCNPDPDVGSIPFGPKAAVLGVQGRMGGSVRLWDDPIEQKPMAGSSERWQLWNWSADAHPIHIHLVKFRVLGRRVIGNGEADDIGPGDSVSDNEPPELSERGWKDTVIAYPGEVTTVAAKFDTPGLYVWHCHILEHEDNEMMVPFCVQDANGSGPGCAGL